MYKKIEQYIIIYGNKVITSLETMLLKIVWAVLGVSDG